MYNLCKFNHFNIVFEHIVGDEFAGTLIFDARGEFAGSDCACYHVADAEVDGPDLVHCISSGVSWTLLMTSNSYLSNRLLIGIFGSSLKSNSSS